MHTLYSRQIYSLYYCMYTESAAKTKKNNKKQFSHKLNILYISYSQHILRAIVAIRRWKRKNESVWLHLDTVHEYQQLPMIPSQRSIVRMINKCDV